VRKAAAGEPVPVPFERSYWVVPGKFLAGAYPGDSDPEKAERKLRGLLAAGIRCIVDLTTEEDHRFYISLRLSFSFMAFSSRTACRSLGEFMALLARISVSKSRMRHKNPPRSTEIVCLLTSA